MIITTIKEGGKDVKMVDVTPPTRTVRADQYLEQLKREAEMTQEMVTRESERLSKIRQDIEVLENAGIKEFELPKAK